MGKGATDQEWRQLNFEASAAVAAAKAEPGISHNERGCRCIGSEPKMVPRLLRHAGRDSSEAHALAKLLGQLDESRAQRRRGHPNLVLQQKILACKPPGVPAGTGNAVIEAVEARLLECRRAKKTAQLRRWRHRIISTAKYIGVWFKKSFCLAPTLVELDEEPAKRSQSNQESLRWICAFWTETGSKHALKPMALEDACRSKDLQRAARRKNGGAPGPAGWAQDDVAALPLDTSAS